jgi:hypothetical protein
LLYAFIILIFTINTPLLSEYYTSFTKEDWRGFSQIVKNATTEGDFVVVVPGYISQPFSYYYNNATDRTIQIDAYTGKDLENIYKQKGNNSLKPNTPVFISFPPGNLDYRVSSFPR